ncbi:hypothetical protein ODJ79_00040 [Actinoplanes sp. KI2]|uniref:hypothetical protein n=1 Tax=Actinoplanes sp. KI2 TaxID=2983315 RepID=UPI0021D5C2BB|nr:hypothetical protein [Actinoplanes sp. KI2]MCU7722097.1 hypothetical protein [Actinoplanes sp. KI2]
MTGAEFRGVDVDLLADYIGGALVDTPDESMVAALIADDPAWRSAYESLSGDMAAVEAELGRLEAVPMPDDIVARLDVALAEATTKPQLTLIHGDAASPVREKRKLRWVTPIAIAAGAVAFVGFGLDYLAGLERGASDKASNTSAAGSGEARQDTAEAPAAAGGQPERSEPYAAQDNADAGKTTALPQLRYTGIDYTEATLAEPAPQPLAASASSMAGGVLRRLSTPVNLQQCLDKIAEANGAGPITVDTVDYAKFEGMPAIVVRFTAKNGTWAWASGPACGTSDRGADTRAKVSVR